MAKQIIETEFGTVFYPETISGYEVTPKVWKDGRKCRVYFSVKVDTKIDCGYIDVVTGSLEIKSRPASWGFQLKQEVEKI